MLNSVCFVYCDALMLHTGLLPPLPLGHNREKTLKVGLQVEANVIERLTWRISLLPTRRRIDEQVKLQNILVIGMNVFHVSE